MTSIAPALTGGYLLDLLIGDPQWMPHPVRWIGKSIEKGEGLMRRFIKSEWIGGSILTVGMILSVYFISKNLINLCVSYSSVLGTIAQTLMIYFCLSTKDLAIESGWVRDALKLNDIQTARNKLSWIVGRDTEHLDEKEIIRGTVETVAESTVDGILSPLFYALIGGAPLALAYKTVNTLDSMIGHKNKRYLYFGRLAANLDRWMNWLPAICSGILLPFCSLAVKGSVGQSLKSAWSGRSKNLKSHSDIPEGAMAGALGVQLGGLSYYKGVPVHKKMLGAPNHALSIEHIDQSIKIMFLASAVFFIIGLILRIIIE